MASHELQISGMTCDHCADSVEKALSGVAGVERSSVSYQEGKARVEVVSGLNELDRVVIGNRSRYHNGEKVQPKEFAPMATSSGGAS